MEVINVMLKDSWLVE